MNSSSASVSSISQSKRRKRQLQPILGGVSSTYEDRNNDFLCPICFNTIEEAYMTKCGHTYCLNCIRLALDQRNRCPKCNLILEKPDQIYPNFLLNELILKFKQRQSEQKKMRIDHPSIPLSGVNISSFLDREQLDISSVNYYIEFLSNQKKILEEDSKYAQNQILIEFLSLVKQKKLEQLNKINQELQLIEEDTKRVEHKLNNENKHHQLHIVPDNSKLSQPDGDILSIADRSSQMQEVVAQEGFNGSKHGGIPWLQSTMASRRRKVDQHFNDLEEYYFKIRQKDIFFSGSINEKILDEKNSTLSSMDTECLPSTSAEDNPSMSCSSLDEFTESLAKFTKFDSFRTLATLSYASDIYNTSSIVSSIEFDRDCDYFAIAGVTKKVKIFEYGTVIRDAVDMHYPVYEMLCNSKISSIIWSSYHKSLLASSDYEGTVTLWDAFTGSKSRIFQEHEKRCWSVDFNRMDPKLLASGSDDSKVKLWCTNEEHSIASIEAKANVCCVKFNSESRYHLAFGSADHSVHYYDLRNMKQSLNVFKGHRKAVSYTKFLNSSEIVSASTDSQLKMWNINQSRCLRTFEGHINEKNFVGLATDGDYVSCGSENNSLFVYYKGLSRPLLTYKFDTVKMALEKEKKEDDANEFVSAVTWRPGSNVIVAANSQGAIKILELV